LPDNQVIPVLMLTLPEAGNEEKYQVVVGRIGFGGRRIRRDWSRTRE
jgi:hypothetical protein